MKPDMTLLSSLLQIGFPIFLILTPPKNEVCEFFNTSFLGFWRDSIKNVSPQKYYYQ